MNPALIMGIVQAGIGMAQTIGSAVALNKLNKQPPPLYSMSPEMKASKARADLMAKQGFTGAETAAFNQNLARNQYGAFRQSLDISGGNMARTLAAQSAASRLNALNEFASQDANLRRQNIRYADSFARDAQNLADRNIAYRQQQRLMSQQQLGAGMQTGMSNLMSGIGLGAAGGSGMTFGKQDMSGFTQPDAGYVGSGSDLQTSYSMSIPPQSFLEQQYNIQGNELTGLDNSSSLNSSLGEFSPYSQWTQPSTNSWYSTTNPPSQGVFSQPYQYPGTKSLFGFGSWYQ